MEIMDCTLRDGANIVGAGFSKELTNLVIEGLIKSNISIIELGHSTGLGSMKYGGKVSSVTDEEYLDTIQPFINKAHLGMFQLANNSDEKLINLAAEKGLKFLRIGANAGDGKTSAKAINVVQKVGLEIKYSIMKAYVLTPKELAKEAKMLEALGVQAITLMDSAGYMFPEQVKEYVTEVVNNVSIPIGFHGHNNLGLAVANAIEAQKAGARFIDCCLMGMARSAGNIPTEVILAILSRQNISAKYKLFTLLDFINKKLMPAMQRENFHNSIVPLDLILGYSGCHSNYLPLFRDIAQNKHIDLYKLIIEVSTINQKNPSYEMIEQVAEYINKKVS